MSNFWDAVALMAWTFIFIPVLTSLLYIPFCGRGIAERAARSLQSCRELTQ